MYMSDWKKKQQTTASTALDELGDFIDQMQNALIQPSSADVADKHIVRITAAIGANELPPVIPPTSFAIDNGASIMDKLKTLPRAAKISVVAAALLSLSSGLAIAGVLPDGLQNAASSAASTVGVSIPEAGDSTDTSVERKLESADDVAQDALDSANDVAESAAAVEDSSVGGSDDGPAHKNRSSTTTDSNEIEDHGSGGDDGANHESGSDDSGHHNSGSDDSNSGSSGGGSDDSGTSGSGGSGGGDSGSSGSGGSDDGASSGSGGHSGSGSSGHGGSDDAASIDA